MILRLALCLAIYACPLSAAPQFSVSFPKERSLQPIDGRVVLVLSTDSSAEPRTQVSIAYKTQQIFGHDVDGLKPGQAVTLSNENVFGYPVRFLRDIKPGDYYIQAVLHRYETFHRADGHTV